MDTTGSIANSHYRWRFGRVEFDEARLELTVNGQPVDLEHKPLQVLALLLHHAGEVVTKRELFDSVWAGRVTVDHVLATAVGKLRKALGAADAARIHTVPRIGYRFDGPVDRLAVGHEPMPHDEAHAQLHAALLAAHAARLALQRSQARRPWVVAVMLMLAAGLGASLWLYRDARSARQRVESMYNALYVSDDTAFRSHALLGMIDYRRGDLERSVAQLQIAYDGLIRLHGAHDPDTQAAAFWLALALLSAGHLTEAGELIESLNAASLQRSLGGKGWGAVVDALRARLLIRQGHIDHDDSKLESSWLQLADAGVPTWVIETLVSQP